MKKLLIAAVAAPALLGFLPKAAVTKNVSFLGKAEDQLLFRSPLLMHFHGTAVNKINAAYRFPFPEDQFPLSEIQVFPMRLDGRQPFRQTLAAQKTALEIAVIR